MSSSLTNTHTSTRTHHLQQQAAARDDTLRKKRRQLSGYESSSPEDNGDDDEIDETFLALQKLLKALNNSARQTSVAPMGAPTLLRSSSSGISGATQSTQSLREELLELRRRERERFRHLLFSKSTRRQRVAHYQDRDDEEEDEEPVMSVESTISNRVISGSFSRLNVHVISRDRWSHEEVERLPIILLPKDGKVVSPADNPKLNVCHTKEYKVLRDQLMDHLQELPDEQLLDHSRTLLTPPQSTWYIQMRDMDAIQC